MDGWMDGWVDGWMDGWVDGCEQIIVSFVEKHMGL